MAVKASQGGVVPSWFGEVSFGSLGTFRCGWGRVCYDKLRFAEAVGVGQCEARSVPSRFVTAVEVCKGNVGYARVW